MEQDKNKIHSLLTISFLVIVIFFTVIVVGGYMNRRFKRTRDIRRRVDIHQVAKLIEIYKSSYNMLPENETENYWDRSYDSKTSDQALFKTLRQNNLVSAVFDPINDEEFHYRYHKFDAGEYGCNDTFAIFQVTSFETETNNIGSGSCPERDFTKEAPNGYTIQWFE